MINPAPQKDDGSQFSAFSLALKLGYIIAVPAVIFVLLGRLLDRHLDLSPLFLIIGLLVALISSSLLIFREIRKIKF